MAGTDIWSGGALTYEEFEDPMTDTGPPVSVRSLRSAARRRRRLWLTTAFIGLLLGAGLHVMLPSKIASVSKLYLVEPAGSDPAVAITNDVNLLETRTVAEGAMGIMHLGSGQPTFTVKGSALGSSILAIKVTAPTATEALARTNAVAQAFLKVRASLQSETTNNAVKSLQAQVQSVQADIQTATSQISALQSSATKAQSVGALTELNNRLNGDNSQKSTLTQEMNQLQQSASSTINDSVVLDSAYVVPVSAKKTALKDGLSGLVAGLALGITFVILSELLSDRVRRRSDVAAALGAPVELSVDRLR